MYFVNKDNDVKDNSAKTTTLSFTFIAIVLHSRALFIKVFVVTAIPEKQSFMEYNK